WSSDVCSSDLSNLYLGEALAAMENCETANVTSSGMGAITATILQLCNAGDHIVSSRTIYGGTYAFMKNFLPKFNIQCSFVDSTDLNEAEKSITDQPKMIYGKTVSTHMLYV